MIKDLIKQIYNKPCWNVEYDNNNSYLTLNIGQPKLKITEPIPDDPVKELQYRRVGIVGEWHLWIFRCHWELFLDNNLLANCQSTSSEIADVLKYINGQKIVNIEIDKDTSNSNFYFDLGGVLKTKRYDDINKVQWILINSKENDEIDQLIVRSDGMYKFIKRREPVDVEVWEHI